MIYELLALRISGRIPELRVRAARELSAMTWQASKGQAGNFPAAERLRDIPERVSRDSGQVHGGGSRGKTTSRSCRRRPNRDDS